MKIQIFVSDLCSGCQEIKKEFAGNPNIEIIELSQEAIAEIIEASGQEELELPCAVVKGKFCRFSVNNNGKLILDCEGGEKINLDDLKSDNQGRQS